MSQIRTIRRAMERKVAVPFYKDNRYKLIMEDNLMTIVSALFAKLVRNLRTLKAA